MTAVSGTVVVTVTLFAMPGGGIAVDVMQYNEVAALSSPRPAET